MCANKLVFPSSLPSTPAKLTFSSALRFDLLLRERKNSCKQPFLDSSQEGGEGGKERAEEASLLLFLLFSLHFLSPHAKKHPLSLLLFSLPPPSPPPPSPLQLPSLPISLQPQRIFKLPLPLPLTIRGEEVFFPSRTKFRHNRKRGRKKTVSKFSL